jgi:hypothetical protein
MQQAGVNDPDRKAHPTVLRKLYRSLKALCDSGAVVALGDGGPGDPKRYCLHPWMVAIGGSKEQYDKACAIFQSDPGANIAAARMMAAMAKEMAGRIKQPPLNGDRLPYQVILARVIRPTRDDDVLPAFRRRCLFASD